MVIIIIPFILGSIYTSKSQDIPIIIVASMNLFVIILQFWIIKSFPKRAYPSLKERWEKVKLNGIVFLFVMFIIFLILMTKIDKIPKDASLTYITLGTLLVVLIIMIAFTSFLSLVIGYIIYRQELRKERLKKKSKIIS